MGAHLPVAWINKSATAKKAYQLARGSNGMDWGRMAGNVLNPANPAAGLPAAATMLGRVGVGAAGGAISGALSPVTQR